MNNENREDDIDDDGEDWKPDYPRDAMFLKEQVRKSGIYGALHRLGYERILDFVENYPGETFCQLAEHLSVMPIVVYHGYAFEAVEQAATRQFAMQTLVREMLDVLPNGWIHKKGSSRFEMKTTHSIAYIKGELKRVLASREDIEATDRVWNALLDMDPPQGWLPKDINNPLIQKAFDIGWPEKPST